MSKQESKQRAVCSCAACRCARASRTDRRRSGDDGLAEVNALLDQAGYARMSRAERRGFVAAVTVFEKLFGVRPPHEPGDTTLH